MREERIEAYIHQRLAELDKQKDLQRVIHQGKLSFGMDSTTYSHLPSWPDLIKRKKQLVKNLWLNGIFLSFIIVGTAGDYLNKFEQNWVKALLSLIVISALIMLFYVIVSFYSLFYQFRQTEQEVRKLIYQDILSQLKKEERELV
jgi:hypothetical protein